MTKRTSSKYSRRGAGFTLVELMITVVIGAILVGIAVPAYTSQVRKARRTDARNALLDLAGREERWLSVSNGYTQVNANVGYPGTNWPQTLINGYYTVSVQSPDPGQPGIVPSFIITATAANSQASDSACAIFTVIQTGRQTALDSSNAINTTTCWR